VPGETAGWIVGIVNATVVVISLVVVGVFADRTTLRIGALATAAGVAVVLVALLLLERRSRADRERK
jgi:hypothetical protein